MFSFVSLNWRGKPLESLEVIVNLIAATTTNTGLKVYAQLDDGSYERGVEITDEQLAREHHPPHVPRRLELHRQPFTHSVVSLSDRSRSTSASRCTPPRARSRGSNEGCSTSSGSPTRNTWSCGCCGSTAPATVKDIAATLQLDYDTLSPLLKRLEAAGLLRHARRPDDERSVEIALTKPPRRCAPKPTTSQRAQLRHGPR